MHIRLRCHALAQLLGHVTTAATHGQEALHTALLLTQALHLTGPRTVHECTQLLYATGAAVGSVLSSNPGCAPA
jgi:hypothetical protein